MKIHFSTTPFGKQRLLKVKAVAALTKTEVAEVAFDEKSPVAKTAAAHSLPILETPQGTLFSTNAIIRFLANSSKHLYGANPHEQGLVDQWLDIMSCEFEPTVGAIFAAVAGKEVNVEQLVQDLNKFLTFVENHLKGKQFLVGSALTIADVSLAANMSALYSYAQGNSERKEKENLFKHFQNVQGQVKEAFGEVTLTEKAHASLVVAKPAAEEKKPKEAKEPKAPKEPKAAKEPKKEAKKEEKPAEDFDPFADEPAAPTPAPAPASKNDAKAAAEGDKKKKKAAVAKSIVVFDVKVYEQETDLKQLAEKIFAEVNMDGLVWNKDIKILPVAYGMNMLEIGCVIEDDKVNTDDIFEKIQVWEDVVQSIDTVAFQKV